MTDIIIGIIVVFILALIGMLSIAVAIAIIEEDE